MENLITHKEEVEAESSQSSDDHEEESLRILSLGDQKIKSCFDAKYDETKDGLLHLFDDEERLLCVFSL